MGSSLNLPFDAADADVPLEDADGSRVRDDADADEDGGSTSMMQCGNGRSVSGGVRS